ncbi:DUF6226 family protein [Arthrobacter sp. H14-L1]|uniref:DUF6226 family protein n=1 Tax=Arthrobacter sp. H14-L1 TaxID=2996697 RepID=UPI00226E24C0|nr:DUF6226 family protein [Arthrobacter sp. H14-L1]MCY0906196.1 DUF6226 family protein [Arthrobacter sp. H14-L1]
MSRPRLDTPLHAVAGALIEWLQSNFEVSVEQDPGVADDLLHLPNDVVRAVRVVPRDPATATLSFVLTKFPGAYLHVSAPVNCLTTTRGRRLDRHERSGRQQVLSRTASTAAIETPTRTDHVDYSFCDNLAGRSATETRPARVPLTDDE